MATPVAGSSKGLGSVGRAPCEHRRKEDSFCCRSKQKVRFLPTRVSGLEFQIKACTNRNCQLLPPNPNPGIKQPPRVSVWLKIYFSQQ